MNGGGVYIRAVETQYKIFLSIWWTGGSLDFCFPTRDDSSEWRRIACPCSSRSLQCENLIGFINRVCVISCSFVSFLWGHWQFGFVGLWAFVEDDRTHKA